MLEPLIVSTRVCDFISKELNLKLFRRTHGIYGTKTARVRMLIVGDVDIDFLSYLSKFAVDITLVRTILRSPPEARSLGIREVFGLNQSDSLDSDSFPIILISDADAIRDDLVLRQLWRVSSGHATVLMWVPVYDYDAITPGVLGKLGCVNPTLSKHSLAEYNYPGNFLVKFLTRKDSSSFFS